MRLKATQKLIVYLPLHNINFIDVYQLDYNHLNYLSLQCKKS
jgi:hypothetical protein